MPEQHLAKMKNLKTPKLYLQVYHEIKDYIVKNELKPGDKLPTEMEMCELLGVSRNVLREAIKSLEITGVVHSTPGVGIVIQQFSTDYLFNSLVYNPAVDGKDMLTQYRKVRRVLELGFAKEAFDTMDRARLDQLQECVRRMETIAQKQTHGKSEQAKFGLKFAEADAAFHRAIYGGLNMPLLISLIDAFWAYDKNYQRPTSPAYLKFTVEKHRRIQQALEAGDYEAFCAALEVHYKVVYRRGESGGEEELLYDEVQPQALEPQ